MKNQQRIPYYTVLLLIGVLVSFWWLSATPRHTQQNLLPPVLPYRLANSALTEKYIIKKASHTPVSSKYQPVLLYKVVGGKDYFFGSATYFVGKKSGPQGITVEHTFYTSDGQHRNIDSPIKLRLIRNILCTNSTEIEPELYVGSITQTGGVLTGKDYAIFSVTNVPVVITNFSFAINLSSRIVPTTNLLLKSGKEVHTFQSIVTGKWHDIVGVDLCEATNVAVINEPCLNAGTISGESGSSFQDEDESLYIVIRVELNTVPNSKRDFVHRNIHTVYTKPIEGITTVLGPFNFNIKEKE